MKEDRVEVDAGEDGNPDVDEGEGPAANADPDAEFDAASVPTDSPGFKFVGNTMGGQAPRHGGNMESNGRPRNWAVGERIERERGTGVRILR